MNYIHYTLYINPASFYHSYDKLTLYKIVEILRKKELDKKIENLSYILKIYKI